MANVKETSRKNTTQIETSLHSTSNASGQKEIKIQQYLSSKKTVVSLTLSRHAYMYQSYTCMHVSKLAFLRWEVTDNVRTVDLGSGNVPTRQVLLHNKKFTQNISWLLHKTFNFTITIPPANETYNVHSIISALDSLLQDQSNTDFND